MADSAPALLSFGRSDGQFYFVPFGADGNVLQDKSLYYDDGLDKLLGSHWVKPLTEPKELIWGNAWTKGYERGGNDHCKPPFSEEEIEIHYRRFLESRHLKEELLPDGLKMHLRGHVSRKPFVEGAWMDKHQGRYYLQYASPGAEYNVYCDSVYIGDSPLRPFTLAAI